MTKEISISDEVYERLNREKGDKTFSEVIADLLETRTNLREVTGTGILAEETNEAVKDDIAELSQSTASRLDDDSS